MNLAQKATTYGTAGVIAAGAGALWAQSLLTWVSQPSHAIVVGGIVTTAAAAKVVSKLGKAKPEAVESSEFDQRVNELAAEVRRRAALPEGTPHTVSYLGHRDHVTHRGG